MNRFTEVERVVRRKVHMHNSCTNDARVNFNELKHVLRASRERCVIFFFSIYACVKIINIQNFSNIKLKICYNLYIKLRAHIS